MFRQEYQSEVQRKICSIGWKELFLPMALMVKRYFLLFHQNLIKRGAEVDALCCVAATPLLLASARGHLPIVKVCCTNYVETYVQLI